MKVHEIHSPGTVHIPGTCNLREAAIQMRDQHVGTLVVTEGGIADRIIGIVTDRDIVLNAVASSKSAEDTAIADVMSRHVMAIDANADLSEAMQVMSSHGIRRLAVTNEAGEVAGVLSLDDIIEALSRDWGMLSGIVRGEQNRERTASVQTPLHV